MRVRFRHASAAGNQGAFMPVRFRDASSAKCKLLKFPSISGHASTTDIPEAIGKVTRNSLQTAPRTAWETLFLICAYS